MKLFKTCPGCEAKSPACRTCRGKGVVPTPDHVKELRTAVLMLVERLEAAGPKTEEDRAALRAASEAIRNSQVR